jgi:hypothetical protein
MARSGFEQWRRRYTEEFWHAQTPTDIVAQSDEKTCLARIRTYRTASDREAVTHEGAHPDALDLSQLVAAWPVLPATLRSAVLEIVRSFITEMEGSRP